MWVALLAGAALIARSFAHARSIRRGEHKVLEAIWSPHLATMIIGLTFLVGLLTAGAWTYSEYLTDLARGNIQGSAGKILLNVALLGGAVFGGWTAGKIRLVAPDIMSVARTFIGGAIMGVGGALIPGGNTGLILVGIPLLWGYAWLAFATICITIYVAVRLSRAA
jgi:toxin CptA